MDESKCGRSKSARRVWTGADEVWPRARDSKTTVSTPVSASSLLSAWPEAPSDDLPLVLQVLGVGGGGMAARGTRRVAESPRQPLQEVAGGAHGPQLI